MKAIRILLRSIRDAYKSVFRNFSLSIASITCIAITLVLVSISLLISSNVNKYIMDSESDLSITVYLKSNLDADTVKDIENQIKSMASYDSLVFKSKEDWKEELKGELGLETVFDGMESNPFDDSMIVYVKNVSDLKATTEAIREIEGIDQASYGEESVDQLVSIFKAIEKVTLIIVVALICVTSFLISNTIRLTIYSRRNEIEIMRLVGTSNIAIKLPFVFEGLFLGIIGSIIPVLLSIYAYIFAFDTYKTTLASYRLNMIAPSSILLNTCGILVLIGGVVGMIGSSYSVRKYLKI